MLEDYEDFLIARALFCWVVCSFGFCYQCLSLVRGSLKHSNFNGCSDADKSYGAQGAQ